MTYEEKESVECRLDSRLDRLIGSRIQVLDWLRVVKVMMVTTENGFNDTLGGLIRGSKVETVQL